MGVGRLEDLCLLEGADGRGVGRADGGTVGWTVGRAGGRSAGRVDERSAGRADGRIAFKAPLSQNSTASVPDRLYIDLFRMIRYSFIRFHVAMYTTVLYIVVHADRDIA